MDFILWKTRIFVYVCSREGTEVEVVAISSGHSEMEPACWEGQAVPLSPTLF